MAVVYLGLGSNLGDRQKNLLRAIFLLGENKIIPKKTSSFIETLPVGGPKQNKFINAVLQAETSFSPQELLITLKKIEREMGRLRTIHNGPRIIDIDILLYENLTMSTPQLKIPHPRMSNRQFVLEPLKEIASELFTSGKIKIPMKISVLEKQKI